jgi:hypothetical protein
MYQPSNEEAMMAASSVPRVLVHPQTHVPADFDTILLARLRAQVEYYFSYQNLSKDTFLQSLLTSTEHIGAVPTEIIANFPKVRNLYATSMGIYGMVPPADPRFIARALQHSQVVSVSNDGRWISPLDIPDFQSTALAQSSRNVTSLQVHAGPSSNRQLTTKVTRVETRAEPSSPSSQNTSVSSFGMPTHPYPAAATASKERCTVIVRDLHPDCTVTEILEAFTTDNGLPKSAKLDVGNTWYINFATEAEACAAVTVSWGKNMRGDPIRARVKSEPPAQPGSNRTPQPPPSPNFTSTTHTYSTTPYQYLVPQPPATYSYVSHHPSQVGTIPYLPTAPAGFIGTYPSGQVQLQHLGHPMVNAPMKQVVVPDGTVVPGATGGVVPSEGKPRKRRGARKRPSRERRPGNFQHPNGASPAYDKDMGTPTKKVSRKRHHQRSPHARGLVTITPISEKQVVNEDNFPSLGGGGRATKAKSDINKSGYAQALLKSSVARDDTVVLTEQMSSTSISMETSKDNSPNDS